jgi:hypothetical protein
MKKLLIITCIISLFLGCKKDKTTTDLTSLNGSWEYRGIACFCAFPGGTPPNSKAGNGDIYIYADGNYKHMQNGTVVKNGTYAIIPDVLNGQSVNRITYDGVAVTTASGTPFFKITDGTKLTFFGTGSLANDSGVELYYERQ